MSAKGNSKVTRAETREARRLFLYGDAQGNPVRSVARLVELSGLGEQSVRKWLPEWEKELEEITAQSSEVGLAIRLSKEVLDENNRHIEFASDQLKQIMFELENVESITARLADWMDLFNGDPDSMPLALRIFEDFVRGVASKSSLRSQFVSMKKLWDEKSAIDGLRDVALVRERELTKGRVKLDLKKESAQPQDARPAIGGGVFNRPVRNLESNEK